ncbi:hypothetical protein Q8A67_009177 [Cirrhinus molitorella]|uniref:Uncharacterized protein n=1 Tax=Cirrhinus molitorella TaxID=172907 RepID=A0AA88PUQ9_9TELE|nr:hypothetical protein Q8A67_009177 [Cirrhinus molitorella]
MTLITQSAIDALPLALNVTHDTSVSGGNRRKKVDTLLLLNTTAIQKAQLQSKEPIDLSCRGRDALDSREHLIGQLVQCRSLWSSFTDDYNSTAAAEGSVQFGLPEKGPLPRGSCQL